MYRKDYSYQYFEKIKYKAPTRELHYEEQQEIIALSLGDKDIKIIKSQTSLLSMNK